MTGSLLTRIQDLNPDIRGKLTENLDLSTITWFRVGGPAEVLYQPADEEDLATTLSRLPEDIPVMILGLGSNLLIRDGGIDGVVIRLGGKGFGQVSTGKDLTLTVGAAVPDVRAAKAAAKAGIAGLSFYRGIPGGIGGALRMNAGAHGGETKNILLSARAVDRQGAIHELTKDDFGYAYRHCSLPKDYIFTQATYQGAKGDPATLEAEMEKVARYREDVQPVKERTGGSTFKNPPGHSAWKVIDEAGLRGFRIGDAQMSEKHCNFMLNIGNATGHDLETLGETVRARVLAHSGVSLEREIKRLGNFTHGNVVNSLI